jgi:hypothetical protein
MCTPRSLLLPATAAAALLLCAAPAGAAAPTGWFRDLRAAGGFAIFTWARAGRVRMAVRAF